MVMLDKIPPQSIESEMAILGSVLLDSKRTIDKVVDLVKEDDFYKDIHRKIFVVMMDMYNQSKEIDIITLTEELSNKKKLEQCGGGGYIVDLMEGVASPANVEQYINIVIEKKRLRKLIVIGLNISQKGYDQGNSLQIIEETEKNIFQLITRSDNEGFEQIDPALDKTLDRLEKISKSEKGLTGIPTGYAKLDYYTGGLQNSDVIVIGARTSLGKTALAMSIISYVGITLKMPVGLFSIEMSKEQLMARMLASEAEVGSQKLRSGDLNFNDWPDIMSASKRIKGNRIFIDDSATLNTIEMRSRSRRLKTEHDVRLIIIDYLQLMNFSGRYENIYFFTKAIY